MPKKQPMVIFVGTFSLIEGIEKMDPAQIRSTVGRKREVSKTMQSIKTKTESSNIMMHPIHFSHPFAPLRYRYRSATHKAHWIEDEAQKHRALWTAVITQALMDAGSNSHKQDAIQRRKEAREWLLTNEEDFPEICEKAGFHPDFIRNQARLAIARNCQWRASSVENERLLSHATATSTRTLKYVPVCTSSTVTHTASPAKRIASKRNQKRKYSYMRTSSLNTNMRAAE